MPYNAANRAAKRKLVQNRWIDADKLYAWAAKAITLDTSLLNERRSSHNALNICYVDPTKARMADDALFIDAHSINWVETVQKLHSFLSDRAVAERKPGAQKQSSTEETTKSDNNLTRAWSAALSTIVTKIGAEQDCVDRTEFEGDLTWQ